MLDIFVQNKLATLGLVVIIAAVSWYGLSGSGSAPQDALVTETFSTPESEADRDLVATLLQLRAVNLDGAILDDPAFQSLKDFGSQIVSEPVGRENPFAPLTGTQSATTSSPTR